MEADKKYINYPYNSSFTVQQQLDYLFKWCSNLSEEATPEVIEELQHAVESLQDAVDTLQDQVGEFDYDTLQRELQTISEAIAGKQDELVAGDGITINGNVISATGVTITLDDTVTQNSSNGVKSSGIYSFVIQQLNALSEDIIDALALKQDVLTFDTTPTANSTNPVTSGGVKTALDGKQNTLTFDNTPTANSDNPVKSGGIKTALDGKQDTLTFDTTPTASSTNPVTSGGVKTALDGKQNTLTFDNTPTANSDNPVKSGGIKTALDGKQDTLTFDTTPTASSTNPVTSGGVKTALDGKQNTLTFDNTPTANSDNPVKSGGIKTALDGKQDTLTFDSTPTASSTNPVTSGGVKTALDGKQDTLTAGTGIEINNNVISATGGGGSHSGWVNINDYKTADNTYRDAFQLALADSNMILFDSTVSAYGFGNTNFTPNYNGPIYLRGVGFTSRRPRINQLILSYNYTVYFEDLDINASSMTIGGSKHPVFFKNCTIDLTTANRNWQINGDSEWENCEFTSGSTSYTFYVFNATSIVQHARFKECTFKGSNGVHIMLPTKSDTYLDKLTIDTCNVSTGYLCQRPSTANEARLMLYVVNSYIHAFNQPNLNGNLYQPFQKLTVINSKYDAEADFMPSADFETINCIVPETP